MSTYGESQKRYYEKNKQKFIEYNKGKGYWKNESLEKRRARAISHQLKKYGLTREQFLEMLKNHNNQCAICDFVFEQRRDVCVDHNHTTGAVRGLLCHKCNIGIAKFDEQRDKMLAAIDYLEKYNDSVQHNDSTLVDSEDCKVEV